MTVNDLEVGQPRRGSGPIISSPVPWASLPIPRPVSSSGKQGSGRLKGDKENAVFATGLGAQ